MILDSAEAIAEYLARHGDFGECILEDIRWCHFGTVLEIDVDYIWEDDGTVRSEYAPKNLKTLVLRNVQELHVCNALNVYMTLHPEELNWGLSEVSSVRLLDEEHRLSKYQALPVPFHHLSFNWEDERRIDVIFSTVEVR
ncbi:MAG: hypothetical protein Q8K82_01230 [Gemmatimonadaceae bacterium]|nr:hypothetical protein [Gemmatimonadaceae bacterium]